MAPVNRGETLKIILQHVTVVPAETMHPGRLNHLCIHLRRAMLPRYETAAPGVFRQGPTPFAAEEYLHLLERHHLNGVKIREMTSMPAAWVDVSLLDITGVTVLEGIVTAILETTIGTTLAIPQEMTFPFVEKLQRIKLGLTGVLVLIADANLATSSFHAANLAPSNSVLVEET
ncbi:hypothetical protein BDV96DRAFT_651400 [Lophiotrema nucula]|uniref:Uncharacterized protein n=1 Tax=Lophiotrema nucula TaxID=690887 RepID=A0A6A5YRT2_9PLEO|nr:hypothetical protein BDV96DRAFT_651400 [Lophiotrema nucula]